MKKLLVLLALVCSAAAQNAPLKTNTVTTTFEAASLPALGQTLPATITDVGISFTPDTTIALETLQAPGFADFMGYYGPAASYQLNFLSKAINDVSPNLSGYRFRFSVTGSVGEVRVADKNHLGGNVRFRTEYALSSGGMWNLAVEVGAARLPGVTKGFAPLVSLGFPVNF